MPEEAFHRYVLDWFDQHGRKNLPWQQHISAYRVWVSEIMLQQTQVNTVIPYFERFIVRFPGVTQLATASEDSVLHHWTGLGYYARARNLHKTAQLIHTQYNNQFPDSVEELNTLPGIGRSTAGAIASIAMGLRAPILDGNVKRVLCRFHAIDGWPGTASVQKILWAFSERHTPSHRVKDYTQAIMDLGATLCTRSNPRCEDCPLQTFCQAYQTNSVPQYPQVKPKQKIPTRSAHFLILTNEAGNILMEKRPPLGIWGGLWSLPQHEDSAELINKLAEMTGYEITDLKHYPHRRHTFSHFHLDMHPIYAKTKGPEIIILEPDRWRWHNHLESAEIGLAAPIKSLLENPAG